MNSKKLAGIKNVIRNPIILQESGLNRTVLCFVAPAWFCVTSAISSMTWLSALVFYLWKKFINDDSNKIKVA